MNDLVIDVLTRAGLTSEQARATVALYTMAQALADIRQQQATTPPDVPAPEPTDEGGDAP